MRSTSQLPDLAFVRVVTSGGPYATNDILSVAFTSPLVGRLAAHGASSPAPALPAADVPLVPESIACIVVRSAGPFREGDELALSFVDPAVARIHPYAANAVAPPGELAVSHASGHADEGAADTRAEAPLRREHAPAARGPSVRVVPVPNSLSAQPDGPASEARAYDDSQLQASQALQPRTSMHGGISLHVVSAGERSLGQPTRTGVRVRLHWNVDRVHRFVRVVDKLFTVDRLGWYRHALAMRLLVPDEIATGDDVSDVEAMRHLHALRTAAVETLGRPLLAALMPNFGVTHEWLEGLDSAAAARAFAGLRDAIAPHVDDTRWPAPDELDRAWTVGTIEKDDFLRAPASSIEALLPLLIPSISPDAVLSEKLAGYRHALSELFGQTAQSAAAVRLNAMSQPNHALDDRLWQLVGVVGKAFGASSEKLA